MPRNETHPNSLSEFVTVPSRRHWLSSATTKTDTRWHQIWPIFVIRVTFTFKDKPGNKRRGVVMETGHVFDKRFLYQMKIITKSFFKVSAAKKI